MPHACHILTVVAIDSSLKAIQHCGHKGRREKLCKSIQGGILKHALHNTVAAGVNAFWAKLEELTCM